jgi:hypothetical protein
MPNHPRTTAANYLSSKAVLYSVASWCTGPQRLGTASANRHQDEKYRTLVYGQSDDIPLCPFENHRTSKETYIKLFAISIPTTAAYCHFLVK